MALNDMTDYCGNSARVLGPKFDKMLSELAMDVNTSEWKCTLDDSTTEAIMPRNQCQGKYLDCINDEISEAKIKMLFDPAVCERNVDMVSNDTNGVDTSENVHQPVNSVKRKCDDECKNDGWKSCGWTRNETNDEYNRMKPWPMFKTGFEELERYGKKFGQTTIVGNDFVPSTICQQQQKPKENVTDVDKLNNNDRLKHIDPKMIELIRSEIMDNCVSIGMLFHFFQIEIELKLK